MTHCRPSTPESPGGWVVAAALHMCRLYLFVAGLPAAFADDYRSPEACRDCHQEIYDGYV